MDLKTLGIKKIRFTNLLGMAFGKRTVLFFPGKQKHVTFEMKGSKFNIHVTKEPFHKGARKEFLEMDLGLPEGKYLVFQKRMIAISLWLSKQALILDPQALTKAGVKAISEMPDEYALAGAGRIKGRELLVDDVTFEKNMRFYPLEALWSLDHDKIYYGWKLSKGKTVLNLGGCFLVIGINCQRLVYYFHQDIMRRLMWHYLMAMLPLGFSCEPKTMARINVLVKAVTLLKKRFGKLTGIVDIVGAVLPVPRKVVKIYCIKNSLPLLKKKVPKEITGVEVIIKSTNLNSNGELCKRSV
jgi:hypothetical protein